MFLILRHAVRFATHLANPGSHSEVNWSVSMSSRKRCRQQGSSNSTLNFRSRVTTAPANLSSLVLGESTSPLQPLTDDSELRAQISTLSSIKSYGYGAIPGAPPRTNYSRSSGKSLIRRCASRVGEITGSGVHQRIRPHTVFEASRDPWVGSLDSRSRRQQTIGTNGFGRGFMPTKIQLEATIERDEFKSIKARREARARGRHLLTRLPRVLQRRDLVTMAKLLKRARVEFCAAQDSDGTAEVDAALIKIKTDILVQAIDTARKARDYDRVKKLMYEAFHYFAILAGLSQIHRHEASYVREYALEDGRSARDAATALLHKRKFREARTHLEDARRCFIWAGGADVELRELQQVVDELQVQENAKCGDRVTEGVASKLKLFTRKDYDSLFKELSEAAEAYKLARDREGAQVVGLVTASLRAIRCGESSFLQLVKTLNDRNYFAASQHLSEARRQITNATKGLALVSPSLTRAKRILSPATGLSPLDIVVELAAIDGLRDHNKCLRALEQGWLDKAQQFNVSAREVFEFVAKCVRSNMNDGTAGSVEQRRAVSEQNQQSEDGDAGPTGEINLKMAENNSQDERTGQISNNGAEQSAATTDMPSFAPSTQDLKEGEALLLKISRAVPTPARGNGRQGRSRPRDLGLKGVRHRVEDLLDEISETEDRIVRSKALKRGDGLMLSFWEKLATLGTVVGEADGNTAGDGGSTKGTTARAANAFEMEEEGKGVQGLGRALSLATAEECLRCLAQAKRAYEEQGFAQQADVAARLSAGIVADRCLAQVPVLVHAKGSRSLDPESLPQDIEDAFPSLEATSVDQAPKQSIPHYTAARAAAREAEDNYDKAGNIEGALRARKTEISLEGDEVMADVEPLLSRRDYDAALEALRRARNLYVEAGPQGLDGLDRTWDPEGVVRAAAMRDGRSLKAQAVQALRKGDIDISTSLCREAQSCFFFADRQGLADETADVEGAICMATRLVSGDKVVATAEAALEEGQCCKADKLLHEAKAFYYEAQLSYESLVDQVTCILEEQPEDAEAVQKAIELQDSINCLYDSRRDGQRSLKVESLLSCLAADTSLQKLAQVVDHEQYEDARTLISSVVFVYERTSANSRIAKAGQMSSLIDIIEKANLALKESRYADAETLVDEGIRQRASLAAERPLSLQPPASALLSVGDGGAKSIVLMRAHAAASADRTLALSMLEKGDFDAAEAAATSSAERFAWWTRQKMANRSQSRGDDTGGSEKLVELPDKDYQAIVREAEELTETVAAAARNARAETHVEEARRLKVSAKFSECVQALFAAARLFDRAGLGVQAIGARAEASKAQGEALVRDAEKLHDHGLLGDIEETLQRAETFFLSARDAEKKLESRRRSIAVGKGLRSSRPDDVVNGAEHHLDELTKFRLRVTGDTLMLKVDPALNARDHDLALRLLIEADRHFVEIGESKWATSPVLNNENITSARNRDAREKDMRRAIEKHAVQDGERLRVQAATAIQKAKDLVKAREFLSMAEACMVWAGVDVMAAGVSSVAKDIKVFECRQAGDEICRRIVDLLLRGEMGTVKSLFEEAFSSYRQGDAFKQIADTQAVMFCVEREENLCGDVATAIASHEPSTALKALQDSRPVFEMAAQMGSVVLHDVAKLMDRKNKHIIALSNVCRAWLHCLSGSGASTDQEDDPDLATILDAALSDLRERDRSGEVGLDIPFALVEECCTAQPRPVVQQQHPPAAGDSVESEEMPEVLSDTRYGKGVPGSETSLVEKEVGDKISAIVKLAPIHKGDGEDPACVDPVEENGDKETRVSLVGRTEASARELDLASQADSTTSPTSNTSTTNSKTVRETAEGNAHLCDTRLSIGYDVSSEDIEGITNDLPIKCMTDNVDVGQVRPVPVEPYQETTLDRISDHSGHIEGYSPESWDKTLSEATDAESVETDGISEGGCPESQQPNGQNGEAEKVAKNISLPKTPIEARSQDVEDIARSTMLVSERISSSLDHVLDEEQLSSVGKNHGCDVDDDFSSLQSCKNADAADHVSSRSSSAKEEAECLSCDGKEPIAPLTAKSSTAVSTDNTARKDTCIDIKMDDEDSNSSTSVGSYTMSESYSEGDDEESVSDNSTIDGSLSKSYSSFQDTPEPSVDDPQTTFDDAPGMPQSTEPSE